MEEFDEAARSAPARVVTNEDGTRQNFCFVPKCAECGANMKPHCMFFDEAYSEHYYRERSVSGFLDESDCLIVVGTALETSFAARIVR